MRSVGVALLISGFFLCVSIVWAALGFLMMGFGLICLLRAERRSKRLSKSTASRQDNSNPRQEPLLLSEPTAAMVSSHRGADNAINHKSYDEEKWSSLLENDPDILRLVEALAPYGQKYVDELATAYLVLNDKDYLPMIIKKIVASAKRDASQDVACEPVEASSPRIVALPRDRTRTLRANRGRDLRPTQHIVKDNSALVSKVPQIEFDQQRRPFAQMTRGRPEIGVTRQDEIVARAARRAEKVEVIAPAARRAARAAGFENTDDLPGLLSKLALETTSNIKRGRGK
jgi:hypothetical protein